MRIGHIINHSSDIIFNMEIFKKILPPIGSTLVIILAFLGWHYDTVNDLRLDYGDKLSALERELNDIKSERDLYFTYLTEMPESIIFLERKINMEKQKSNYLQQQVVDQLVPTDEEYSKETSISKGDSYLDKKSGLFIALLDIDRSTENVVEAKIKTSLATGEESTLSVSVGDSWYFKANEQDYKLMISKTNWYGNFIDITITNQRTNYKLKLVPKKYIFQE